MLVKGSIVNCLIPSETQPTTEVSHSLWSSVGASISTVIVRHHVLCVDKALVQKRWASTLYKHTSCNRTKWLSSSAYRLVNHQPGHAWVFVPRVPQIDLFNMHVSSNNILSRRNLSDPPGRAQYHNIYFVKMFCKLLCFEVICNLLHR